jgi:hypothetical protein
VTGTRAVTIIGKNEDVANAVASINALIESAQYRPAKQTTGSFAFVCCLLTQIDLNRKDRGKGIRLVGRCSSASA